MRILIAAVACLLLPALAQAQNDTPRLPRNDATLSIGWHGAWYDDVGQYDHWHGTLFGGVSTGHYWTQHLKTDVEAAWLSRAKATNYEPIIFNGASTYVSSTYLVKDLKLSLAQSFQFGRNAWVHPYVGAGADIIYRHETEDRAPQFASVFTGTNTPSRSVLVPASREHETDIHVVPFVKGGFKMYVSDRAFFVQEFKFGLGEHLDHALWKTGIGFDF
jgi:hypothetical protein